VYLNHYDISWSSLRSSNPAKGRNHMGTSVWNRRNDVTVRVHGGHYEALHPENRGTPAVRFLASAKLLLWPVKDPMTGITVTPQPTSADAVTFSSPT
jgi:hypothetical protein